jgi:hypothetical protein
LPPRQRALLALHHRAPGVRTLTVAGHCADCSRRIYCSPPLRRCSCWIPARRDCLHPLDVSALKVSSASCFFSCYVKALSCLSCGMTYHHSSVWCNEGRLADGRKRSCGATWPGGVKKATRLPPNRELHARTNADKSYLCETYASCVRRCIDSRSERVGRSVVGRRLRKRMIPTQGRRCTPRGTTRQHFLCIIFICPMQGSPQLLWPSILSPHHHSVCTSAKTSCWRQ